MSFAAMPRARLSNLRTASAASQSLPSLSLVSSRIQRPKGTRGYEVLSRQAGAGGRSSTSGVIATVFGSTGSLGRYVVNRLGRTGSQVVCGYRGDEYEFKHMRLMGDYGQIIPFQFDPTDTDAIYRAIEGSNTVINLMGKAFNTFHFTQSEVHVDLARTVAKASSELGVSRLLHVSAMAASHDAPSEFHRTKAAGEEAVVSEFADATVFRPATIFGAEDKFLNRFAFLGKALPVVPLINQGKTLLRPVYVDDVAQAMVKTLQLDGCEGKTYELAGPDLYTMREIQEYVYKTIEVNPYLLNLPDPVSQLYGRILEIAVEPKLTRDNLKEMKVDIVPGSGSLGLKDLGITPTELETVGIDILRRYQKQLGFLEVQ